MRIKKKKIAHVAFQSILLNMNYFNRYLLKKGFFKTSYMHTHGRTDHGGNLFCVYIYIYIYMIVKL